MHGNSRSRSGVLIGIGALVLALGLSSVVLGEVNQSDDEARVAADLLRTLTDADSSGGGSSSASTQGESTADLPASSPLSKLQFHGFLTQAYAKASFLDLPPELGDRTASDDEITIGIPEDGTTNYRFLALQFRYQISPKDIMIVQFSSRTLGFSPVTDFENEIELDWAFYQRRLTDSTNLKVGRVQIPMGIYNEIRDVGTVIPFYRPPYGWYGDGTFTSETIDGVLLDHTFLAESDWTIDFSIYGGEYRMLEFLASDPTNSKYAREKDAFGFQIWLNTPLPEFRIGAGLTTRKAQGGVFNPGRTSHGVPLWYASIDGTFGRVTIRAEARTTDTELDVGPPLGTLDLNFTAHYVQLGFKITEKFETWLQYDHRGTQADNALFTRPDDFADRNDYGIALRYAFAPNVVLKAEYHETDEEASIYVPVFDPTSPFGFRLDPQRLTLDNGSYSIVSLSVSF